MVTLQKIALVFSIIGAINWGLIGLFGFNLVSFVFGDGTFFESLIYVIVAIAGLINIELLVKDIDIK